MLECWGQDMGGYHLDPFTHDPRLCSFQNVLWWKSGTGSRPPYEMCPDMLDGSPHHKEQPACYCSYSPGSQKLDTRPVSRPPTDHYS